MKRLAALTTVLALALAGCTGAGTPAASGPAGAPTAAGGAPATVRVAHVPSSLFSPLYVAQEKGYFTEQGLTVELEAVKSGQDAVPLLASGRLDALAAGFSAGMFNARNSGMEFQVVGSMGINTGDPAKSPTALLGAQKAIDDGSVSEVAQLRGKRIAAAGGPGATGGFLVASILAPAGLTLKDVEIVNIATPDMPNALSTGAVDAALVSAPTSSRVIGDKLGGVLAVPAGGVSSTGLMYGPAFAAKPEAQKFFNALAKASGDLQGDGATSDENLAILAKATSQDVAVLKASPSYRFDAKLAPQPTTIDQMEQSWMTGGQINYSTPLGAQKLVNAQFSQQTP